MLKKLTNCVSLGFEKIVDFSQNQMFELLSKRYPDINEVLEVLDRLKGDENAIDGPKEEIVDDGRWRPMLLTIGLLYKLHRIQETDENCWYNRPDIFLRDDDKEKDYLHIFGFYWHLCVQVAEVLRSTEMVDPEEAEENVRQEQLKNALQAKIEHLEIETVLANTTDDNNVDDHCPDFAFLVDHPHNLIVINICGTRMLPAPKISDVFMDLCATAEPFMHGRAHRGMAIGARNILEKVHTQLEEAVERNPSYGILVTGYSLGAGICQLVAMDLLQERSNVRCISYGAPLVFEADIEQNADIEYGKNLFTVVCSHDGLASASLSTVSKLLAQVRAIDNLQLRKRDMIKLLASKVSTSDGAEMKEDDDSEDDDEFDKDKLSHKPNAILNQDWQRIQDAISQVSEDQELAKLTHPALNIFVFKRRPDGEVITRYFQDGAMPFSDNLRLRAAMFNHHMPWSYKSLFEGYGLDQESTPVELVNSVLNL